jgi:hypothetical protein
MAAMMGDRSQDELIRRLNTLLDSVSKNPPKSREEIRAEVKLLAEVMETLRKLNRRQLEHLTEEDAARQRILAYLRMFPGEIIEGRELEVVAGIRENARRIRDLRESGYRISSGVDRKDLRPDQYVLESLKATKPVRLKRRTAKP